MPHRCVLSPRRFPGLADPGGWAALVLLAALAFPGPAAAAGGAPAASPVAQAAPAPAERPVTLRGTIAGVDGSVLRVTTAQGVETVTLVPPLAVTGARRDPQLPDVPTAREQGLPALESVGFQGLVGPAGMPKDVVDKLAAELAKVLANAELKAKFAAAGSEVHSQGPAEFAAFVKADNEKWAKLIKERKLQLD